MKTLQEIFDIIESKSISIDNYEENNKLCGYELNTYTDGGVNQIMFIDFRNGAGDATSAEDFVRLFTEYVESIDIDDEIEVNRQDPTYKAVFTLKQSVADFEAWKEGLEELVEKIS